MAVRYYERTGKPLARIAVPRSVFSELAVEALRFWGRPELPCATLVLATPTGTLMVAPDAW